MFTTIIRLGEYNIRFLEIELECKFDVANIKYIKRLSYLRNHFKSLNNNEEPINQKLYMKSNVRIIHHNDEINKPNYFIP